ncbi:MAG: hypothetical protein LBV36_09120 [Chromatiales bacterium]|jgi:hypothetical protein|nr:hypothetical protein [Chromatiales bacterium]
MRLLQLLLIGLTASLALAWAATAPTSALKFHPGHYVSLNLEDAPDVMRTLAQPGIRGVQVRYTWRSLEPERDHYDFSRIDADLRLASSLGLHFVAFIEDKSFNSDEHLLPDYLADKALPFTRGGYVAKRWDPFVVERFGALFDALGARFDQHPDFEGIALQESAMGFSADVAREQNYTPEAYRDALIEILTRARQALPSSQIFWYMNFLEGGQKYLADIATAVIPLHIAMGGPDVLPNNPALARLTYPLYARFAGQLTLFNSMQYNSFAHRHANPLAHTKYWTLQELLDFARDELHVSYLFWNHKTWRKPLDSWNWDDALIVIRKNPELP